MARLDWNRSDKNTVSFGLSNVVFYPPIGPGVVWNGVMSVDETSKNKIRPVYADGIKILDLAYREDFTGKITAFGSPKEFAVCDGRYAPTAGLEIWQHTRVSFGLSFKTYTTNGQEGSSYKISLLYNLLATPSEKKYVANEQTASPVIFSWGLTSKPVDDFNLWPITSITVDASTVDSTALSIFEEILYGTSTTNPRLPEPWEVFRIFDVYPYFFTVTDMLNGEFLIEGTDNEVREKYNGIYNLTDPGVTLVEDGVYNLYSP